MFPPWNSDRPQGVLRREVFGAAMKVSLRCPRTDQPLQISIADDDNSVADKWRKHVMFSCPHCGRKHSIKYRAAWVSGLMGEVSPAILAIDDQQKSKSRRA
jgi:hypothetical protein